MNSYCYMGSSAMFKQFFGKGWRFCGTLLAVVLFSSGCTLAPKYLRPDAPIPNIYPAADGTQTADYTPWRDFFKDQTMQRLIGLALENNRDLRIALLNIEKTRAQYHIQATALLPTVNAVGSSSTQNIPVDISGPGAPNVARQYSASLGFSNFELDLFGRIRSLTEVAKETFYSVENDAQTARLSLVSEVAGMYLQMVSDRQLLDITQATYDNRKKEYESVSRRYDSGIASLLEVNQAKTVMEEARTNLARYKVQVEQDENALALLIGTSSLPMDLPNVRRLEDVVALPDVPAGLPSSLLERRPDIMSVEHSLKASNANIGAARANFFPTISLTGSVGTLSADYSNLFKGAQGAWAFLPQATLPIFDTGRNIAQLKVSKEERNISVAQYEKTIQNAFREVADSLVQRKHMAEQLAAQKSLLLAAQSTYRLAESRYTAGIDNQLTLLESQRTLYSARQGYIATLLLRESNALTLYKTLGGGWR